MKVLDNEQINIVKTSTHIKIMNTHMYMRGCIELMEELTSLAFDGSKVPLGHIYDMYSNILRIPAGYSIERVLEKFKTVKTNTINIGAMPILDSEAGNFICRATPFPYQKLIVDRGCDIFKKQYQFIIDLKTGKGKSLTAIMLSARLSGSTLIICKTEDLMKQWYTNIIKHTNCKREDIMVVVGMQGLNHIENMSRPYKFYIILHASLRSIIERVGYKKLNQIFHKMNIGKKIVDEFDTEVSTSMELDLNTAIRYNIYCSATVYKNSPSEDKVFKHAYYNVERMGGDFFDNEVPNRDMIWVEYDSKPTPPDRFGCYVNGNFISYKHNDYMFKKRTHIIKGLTAKYIKKYFEIRQPGDVGVIYVEKISTCTIMFNILVSLGVKPSEIGIVNSEIKDAERASAFSKPIIITTTKSFGRGLDVPGIVYILNYENYAGLSIFEQHIGRIGRTGGKRGLFINASDKAFKILQRYNAKKKKNMHTMFDKITFEEFEYKEEEE